MEPIRNREQLDQCFEIAREHDRANPNSKMKWELLLIVGFNTSLRISDIARYRLKELSGQEYARTVAQKTGKDTRILINPAARREIKRLTAGRGPEEYLFQSRERNRVTQAFKPITRQRAWQIINAICRTAGIKDRIGRHTLRKTFGYHYYKMTGDVVSLQRILGHNSQRDTLVYIGVIQDEIDESLRKFKLVGRR